MSAATRKQVAREAVLRHPLRRRIISWLHKDFAPHMLAELCDDLSLSPAPARYHCDVLAVQNVIRKFDWPDGPLIESLTRPSQG